MTATKQDPEVHAVNTIVQSLRPLDAESQQRVLQSSLALLGLAIAGRAPATGQVSGSTASATPTYSGPPHRQKPKGLTELLLEKKPGTNSQRIVLFAYYRRDVEQIDNFDRQDLKSYFARARIAPPGNYDRDYAAAMDRGWIHDDGPNSYLTTTGEQLVNDNFEGARAYKARSGGSKKKTKKKTRKKAGKKTPKKTRKKRRRKKTR